jgi:hypothetical protein
MRRRRFPTGKRARLQSKRLRLIAHWKAGKRVTAKTRNQKVSLAVRGFDRHPVADCP